MSATETTENSQAVARAALEQIHHLQRIRDTLELLLVDVGIGGSETDRIIDNSPAAGHRRRSISQRRLQGSDKFTVPSGSAAIVSLMPANPGRIGGQLVNTGSNPVIICLCDPGSYIAGATPAMSIAAGGGAWDMTISKSPYTGPVSVYGSGGASTITWVVA